MIASCRWITAPTRRKNNGLESLFREIFPIVNFDKTVRLEYLYYELEKPVTRPTNAGSYD